MKARITILAGLVVVAGTGLWLAQGGWRENAALEIRINAATGEREKLNAELTAARKAAQDGTAGGVAAKFAVGAAVASTGAARGQVAAAFPPRTRPPNLDDLAADSPQLWNSFIESKRAELGRDVMPIFLRLGLSIDRQEKVRDILAEAVGREVDISAAISAKGGSRDDPAIVALRKESDDRRRAELMQVLGADGVRQFEDFERVVPLRGYVDGLAQQVADTFPISGLQADRLEKALGEANPEYREGKYANAANIDWAAVDVKARDILMPEQFVVWQRGLAHNVFGGSRRDQELKKVFDAAVARTAESAREP